MRRFIPILLLVLLFSSCQKTIDLDAYRPDPKLVINSFLKVGEPVSVEVTRTWFHQEQYPDIVIKDADVKLYINDVLQAPAELVVDSMNTSSSLYYRFNSIPSANDRIRITASRENYPDASAETVIPDGLPLSDYQFSLESDTSSWMEGTYNVFRSYQISFSLDDNPAQDDYYMFYFRKGWVFSFSQKDSVYSWTDFDPGYSKIPLLAQQASAFDKILGYDIVGYYNGIAFSDELFNGKSYHFNFTWNDHYSMSDGGKEYPDKYKVAMYSISKSYYNYMKTMNELLGGSVSGDLGEAGFAEPIRVFSNVEGGTGIVGGGYSFNQEF